MPLCLFLSALFTPFGERISNNFNLLCIKLLKIKVIFTFLFIKKMKKNSFKPTWAFYSGDINQDGFVEGSDFPILSNNSDNFI